MKSYIVVVPSEYRGPYMSSSVYTGYTSSFLTTLGHMISPLLMNQLTRTHHAFIYNSLLYHARNLECFLRCSNNSLHTFIF